ncbi:MAG: hypothetical protein P8Z73_03760 [Desulfobacteraceae bacterium]|jgi:hypothetical protein
MGVDKRELIHALNTSVKELQQGIDLHCCLVTSIIEGQVDERNLKPLLDLCPKRSHELLMRDAIKEAIDVLEESRKAFKSKRLEVLRKKLTQVLIDLD